MTRPPDLQDGVQNAAASMLRGAGLGPLLNIEPLPGGSNNRGYIAQTPQREIFIKAYFRDPRDPRDRLAAEFQFSQFVWSQGIRCVPEPLAVDPAVGFAAYGFVEGRKLAPGEVTPDHVHEAIAFWRSINRFRAMPAARSLPAGSEACFSVASHLACVERRIAKLGGMETNSPAERAAAAFVQNELEPAWLRLVTQIGTSIGPLSLGLDDVLEDRERCLSPSDFGFHNALVTHDAGLVFFDFEYAGWDDPAKVACDFFCQPKIPAPFMFEQFVTAQREALALPEAYPRRAMLLLNVYRVKWCCVMLNVFLPVGGRRREFAEGSSDLELRKRAQLELARQTLTQASI